MVTSLKKNFSILIYEKEKLLNSILYYQISNHNNFKVSVKDNKLEMFEVLSKKKFDTCIINLNLFNEDIKKFYDMFENNNNHNKLWVPEGFAHGFQTLQNNTELIYLHDEIYNREAEEGLSIFSPELAIDLDEPVSVISERDKTLPIYSR